MELIEITSVNTESWALVAGYSTLVLLLAYVVNALLLGRVFKKAGYGYWRAWVPVVRNWTFFQAGKYNGANIFWAIGSILASSAALAAFSMGQFMCSYILSGLSICLGIVYIIFLIAAAISIQKKLHKPLPFILLYFINLIAPLWLWILSLDFSKYNAKKGHQAKK